MKVHHRIERPSTERPLVLAIGFFDGVHRGHREILRALMRLRRPGFRAAVLTFRNHPATHLRPDKVPSLLTTVEERVNLLAATGIDELFLVPFDERIARIDARTFCDEVVFGTLGASALVIGENFRFGAGRGGDATLARDVLRPRGVEVVAVPPLHDRVDRISSTRARAAVLRGDMETANRLLGESYALRGRVVIGEGRGHDLEFPTANLAVDPAKSLPADGVYTAVARYDGRDFKGLVSIGTNPTFEGRARTIEAWLLDFQPTIYGEELTLRDFHFIREQRKFDAPEELLAQMREDATHVRFPPFLPT